MGFDGKLFAGKDITAPSAINAEEYLVVAKELFLG
jgi:hypothetical protein